MQLSLQKGFYLPDYEAEKSTFILLISILDKCSEFISTFQDPSLKADPIHGKLKYLI